MASVEINEHEWFVLTNKTVQIEGAGRRYGGIGGGFSTLTITLPLSAGITQEGENAIRFRFNRTNGVSSGFRVLTLNFKDEEGRNILPASDFVQEDPNTWAAPFNNPTDIGTGAKLWRSAPLKANG